MNKTVTCKRCGAVVPRTNGNQSYCPACREDRRERGQTRPEEQEIQPYNRHRGTAGYSCAEMNAIARANGLRSYGQLQGQIFLNGNELPSGMIVPDLSGLHTVRRRRADFD